MNKKLNLLLEGVFEKLNLKDLNSKAAILTLWYFIIGDLRNRTNKAQVFSYLFLSNDGRHGSAIKASLINHIGERTLYRYKNEFLAIFRICIELIKYESQIISCIKSRIIDAKFFINLICIKLFN